MLENFGIVQYQNLNSGATCSSQPNHVYLPGVIGYSHNNIDRSDREKIMRAAAGDFLEKAKLFGLVVPAVNLARRGGPAL